ncbi:unnamed protein product [Paramecium sonneborni]|uniref:Transmembrane protein n=1 Tax=Paramecium sonneborni TaxID=65129 RepID=A0A8S1MCJ2_9CILI|nr:unnamed protein product [Paramecium sonneborni]
MRNKKNQGLDDHLIQIGTLGKFLRLFSVIQKASNFNNVLRVINKKITILGAQILKGYFNNQKGIDLQPLFKQKGDQILEDKLKYILYVIIINILQIFTQFNNPKDLIKL